MKILYTDIDLVLSLMSEITPHMTKWGLLCRFNTKAVSVYNSVLEKTQAVPVITSDWKLNHSFEELKEIFDEWAHIKMTPVDVTISFWGDRFKSLQDLEECRAMEILEHVERTKPESWVAIDDLDLSSWIDENHFVHLPRMNEGIKQTGKAQKIIECFNKQIIA